MPRISRYTPVPSLMSRGSRFERRNDAVVRRDLAVVPGARTLGAVELAHDRAQRRIGLEQAVQDGGTSANMLSADSRVRTRVRRGLCVSHRPWAISNFLHVQPKLLGTDLPQGAQVEQQRRAFAHALGSTDTTWALPERESAARPAGRPAAAGNDRRRRCSHRAQPTARRKA